MTRIPVPSSDRARPGRAPRQALRRPARPLPGRRPAAHPPGDAEASARSIRRLQDSLSQSLFAGSLLAHSLGRLQGPGDSARLQDGVSALQRLHRGALAELRMLELEQQPAALMRCKLPELLQLPLDALTGRGGPLVHGSIGPCEGRAGARGRHVYRIAQEALANAGRHSGASQVLLRWALSPDGKAQLRIADDGHGFDPADGCPRPGLAEMQRRAAAIGARLTLSTAPGRGCELILDLPWRQ